MRQPMVLGMQLKGGMLACLAHMIPRFKFQYNPQKEREKKKTSDRVVPSPHFPLDKDVSRVKQKDRGSVGGNGKQFILLNSSLVQLSWIP